MTDERYTYKTFYAYFITSYLLVSFEFIPQKLISFFLRVFHLVELCEEMDEFCLMFLF